MSTEKDLGFEEADDATDEDERIDQEPEYEVESIVRRRVIDGQVSILKPKGRLASDS